MTEPGSVRIGIAWMLLTTLLWVCMDSLSKYLSHTYPVPQISWMRFAVHSAIALAVLSPSLRELLPTRRWRLQLVRSALLASCTILSFFSLQALPLLFVAVVMTLAPLVVTALSVPVLGEHVGWRRWCGVLAGLSGALVVVGPATIVVSVVVLLPLGAMLVTAFYQLATRLLGASESPRTTILYTGLVGTAIGLAAMPLVWVGIVPVETVWLAPDALGWALLTLLGALGVVSHFCMILAFSMAQASVVAPFTYSGLVWSALFGVVFFGELPTASTIAGALIIVSSGLYIARRERAVARAVS